VAPVQPWADSGGGGVQPDGSNTVATVPARYSLLTGNGDTSDSGTAGADAGWAGAPSSDYGPGSTHPLAFRFGGQNGLTDSGMAQLGTDDLTVSFDIDTTQAAATGGFIDVLGYRASCAPGVTSDPYFDIRLTGAGLVDVQLASAGVAPLELRSTPWVTDGNWHRVQVSRSGTTVTLAVDGEAISGTLPAGASLVDAAAWQVADGDPCDAPPPTGDQTVPLVGEMANIYVGPSADAPSATLP
jgi:hypothetical protein